MKKLIIIALTLLAAMPTIAAPGKSFAFLIGKDPINVVLDYSLLQLQTIDRAEFDSVLPQHEAAWYILFLNQVNASNAEWKLSFGDYPEARYTLSVLFIQADAKAAMQAVFRIIDITTVSEVCSYVVSCRGGFYGSFYEIFSESVERIGEEIGDMIKDNMY